MRKSKSSLEPVKPSYTERTRSALLIVLVVTSLIGLLPLELLALSLFVFGSVIGNEELWLFISIIGAWFSWLSLSFEKVEDHGWHINPLKTSSRGMQLLWRGIALGGFITNCSFTILSLVLSVIHTISHIFA